MATLSDIGERELVRRINAISIEQSGHGLVLDDSVPIDGIASGGCFWATTDPGPIPCLVQVLEMGTYYHSGWLLAVKSLSDLAAMGCEPHGLLIAVEFPSTFLLEDFDEFFRGVIDCTKAHNTRLVGGNLKERSDRIHGVAFAMGSTSVHTALRRGKANPGDVLVIIDKSDMGAFWAGVAAFLNNYKCEYVHEEMLNELTTKALLPRAKIDGGRLLLEYVFPTFTMDTSDGLLSCLIELIEDNNIDIILNLDRSCFSESVVAVADACNADYRLWGIAWGNYHLLCTVSKEHMVELKKYCRDFTVIGKVTPGDGSIYLESDGSIRRILSDELLSGEQFVSDSFWKYGIDKYINLMMNTTIDQLLVYDD